MHFISAQRLTKQWLKLTFIFITVLSITLSITISSSNAADPGPTGLVATPGPAPSRQINLYWDAQATVGGQPVTSYWVAVREHGSLDPWLMNTQVSAAGNFHQVNMSGLNANTQYDFYVEASDNSNNRSDPSEIVTYSTISDPDGTIGSCVQLQNMNFDLDINYSLTQDIVCDDTQNWINGVNSFGFEPIGNNFLGYNGTFNGNGFTISGLQVDSTGQCVGLFAHLNPGGIIKNVNVQVDIDSDQNKVGGLVGCSSGTIQNSSTSGNVTGQYCVGGIVGFASDDISAVDCTEANTNVVAPGDGPGLVGSYSSAVINGVGDVGGALGHGEHMGIVSSYATGNVTSAGDQDTGGFAGQLDNSQVVYSYATGNVIGDDYDAGGFAGDIDSSIVSSSYATGDVSSGQYVGGFVGDTDEGDLNVIAQFDQNFATGNVTADYNAGGFAGDVKGAEISNSYSRGNVTANERLGSFSGDTYDGAVITNSYSTGTQNGGGGFTSEESDIATFTNSFYDAQTSGITSSFYGASKTTEQMRTKAMFQAASWDFTNIWNINDNYNDGYPVFLWDHEYYNLSAGYTISTVTGNQVGLQVEGSCQLATMSTAKETENSKQDVGYDYSQGLVGFTLVNCNAGEKVSVTLQFSNVEYSNFALRKYTPSTGSYFAISNAQFSTFVSEGQNGVSVKYDITDGGQLDSDGIANGTIVDPTGLATLVVAAPRTGLGGSVSK